VENRTLSKRLPGTERDIKEWRDIIEKVQNLRVILKFWGTFTLKKKKKKFRGHFKILGRQKPYLVPPLKAT
jgi:hypothetical protein